MLINLAGGVITGLGLLLLATTILPKRAADTPAPAPYTPSYRPTRADNGLRPGPLSAAALPLVPLLEHLGLPREIHRRDLALLERDTATHLAQQIGAALALMVFGAGFFLLLHAGGLPIPAGYLAASAGIPALYGFTAPNASLRSEAARHRDALRQATGSFLTLAALALAAGGNLNEALAAAGHAGDGAAADQLRGALAYAESSGTPAWDALAELGHRAQVHELTELAAAVSLSGHEGARLRTTLTTKSKALRERQLAAREAAEIAASEKTALPTALLMLGYLLLIAAPAAASALRTL